MKDSKQNSQPAPKPQAKDNKFKGLITTAISIVIFIFIAWLYFYPNDTQGDVLQQGDVMQGAANGQEVSLFQQQTGEKSWWTNSLFGGMPTFQISPSYSSGKILSTIDKIYSLRILGFPEPVSWLFMLMLGFFILMLAFKVKWYLAVLGAIGYAFSSYFIIIMGAGHIWKLLTLAYIPPTIAGIVLCYRGKWLAGGALTALFAALQLHSNHIQMSYYFLMVILALVVAFLVMALKEKKIKRWCVATVTILAAGLLAVAANSPNLIMSNKYAKETMRGGHSELTATDNAKPAETTTNDGLSKEYITQWSYGIDETLTLLVPNANGGTSNKSLAETSKFEDMQYSGDLDDLSSQAMPIFTQYFGDQPFTSGPVYVGALIFALFIIGCIVVKGPIKWMLLAVTLLSILLSWGHNFMSLTDFFIDCVPFYNKFRTVSSILVIAEFTMPVLAVLGLHKLFTAKDESKSKNELALYIGFGVSALICLMFVLMPGAGITDADNRVFTMASGGEMGQLADHPELCKNIVDLRNSLVSADALYALMILIFGFGVLFTYMKWWRKVSPMVPSLILAGIVLIDLVVVDKRYLNSEAFTPAEMVTEAKFEKTPADEQILKDTTMNYRMLDVAHFMEPRSSYYHKTVGGYHAAKLTRYNDLIEKQLTKNNMAVINMLNTKYFMIDENQIQPNPEALGNAWWVDSLEYVDNADAEMKFLDDFDPSKVAVADKKFKDALGAAETTEPGDTIFETTYAPNSLTYHSHSAKGGIAVFSEIYFPWGWTATVDGKEVPIGRVNYVLRALRLPAGDHTIVFKFDPQEVHKTVSVATIAVIVILLLAVAALTMPWLGQLFRRKKENEVEEQ